MKYFDFLQLKYIDGLKNIVTNVDDENEIIESEYIPEKLCQKVFSFGLFVGTKSAVRGILAYVGGMIFNYKLFLHNYDKYFKDYKMRVYIDRKSFLENDGMIYLNYLKLMENAKNTKLE